MNVDTNIDPNANSNEIADTMINQLFDLMESVFTGQPPAPELREQLERLNHTDQTDDIVEDSIHFEENNDSWENTVVNAPSNVAEVFDGEGTEVIRYLLQSYASTDNNDIIQWFAYYVPEHEIEIKVRKYGQYLSNVYREPLEINKANSPKNKFQMDHSGNLYQTKLEKIKVSKHWIDSCIALHETEQKLKTLKNQLFFNAPIAKTRSDLVSDCFNKGMECFESQCFEKGRNYFLECLELMNATKIVTYHNLCYYNIACCYSREHNINEALKWLDLAVINGYSNWSHTITDSDMFELHDCPEFIELIKKMMKVNPIRDVEEKGVIESVNMIDIFLKEYGLIVTTT